MNKVESKREEENLKMDFGFDGISGNARKIWMIIIYVAYVAMLILSALVGDGAALRALLCLGFFNYSKVFFIKYQLTKQKIYLVGVISLSLLAMISFIDFIRVTLR